MTQVLRHPKCQCYYPVLRVSVSLYCTQSVNSAIQNPECNYPVLRVSVSLSITLSLCHYLVPKCHYPVPSVSIIIHYPDYKCYYPVPRVSVSLSNTPSVSVINLHPEEFQRRGDAREKSCMRLWEEEIRGESRRSCEIILYRKCQRHYTVPQVSASLSCTPSVSIIILYPSVSVIILYPKCQCNCPAP
ncbi:unnamed protein product [Ranitomeya imitator]|uniref:Uncharacterized protein n=1 Tax=Ranitomeya imitator TaxID=111125 RepID=A0ABN9LJ67_9NEOB|nr:unnamed protein product [Ranitomeya imitator]